MPIRMTDDPPDRIDAAKQHIEAVHQKGEAGDVIHAMYDEVNSFRKVGCSDKELYSFARDLTDHTTMLPQLEMAWLAEQKSVIDGNHDGQLQLSEVNTYIKKAEHDPLNRIFANNLLSEDFNYLVFDDSTAANIGRLVPGLFPFGPFPPGPFPIPPMPPGPHPPGPQPFWKPSKTEAEHKSFWENLFRF